MSFNVNLPLNGKKKCASLRNQRIVYLLGPDTGQISFKMYLKMTVAKIANVDQTKEEI